MEQYRFIVNGREVGTEEDKPLLRYLRDDLKCKSVKDGCSEGACGTCTIIIDGKAMRSCILTTKKAVGKNIVTVEGLRKKKPMFMHLVAQGQCSAVSVFPVW